MRTLRALCVESLLTHVSRTDVDERSRRIIDARLSAEDVLPTIRGSLTKSLGSVLLYRAFLGLPSIGEAARRHLATLSTKKTGEILRDELISSIDSCIDQVALHACVEVLHNLTGRGKLKRELGGVDIDKHTKDLCRAAINRGEQKLLQLARTSAPLPVRKDYLMVTDDL